MLRAGISPRSSVPPLHHVISVAPTGLGDFGERTQCVARCRRTATSSLCTGLSSVRPSALLSRPHGWQLHRILVCFAPSCGHRIRVDLRASVAETACRVGDRRSGISGWFDQGSAGASPYRWLVSRFSPCDTPRGRRAPWRSVCKCDNSANPTKSSFWVGFR